MTEHEQPERAKRLSLSQILELVLSRGASDRSSVTLTRTGAGDTHIEVKVRTGDSDAVATADDAKREARRIFNDLRDEYPPAAEHDNAAVVLTRNAKGETQLEVEVKTNERIPRTASAVAEARERFAELERLHPYGNHPDEGKVSKIR